MHNPNSRALPRSGIAARWPARGRARGLVLALVFLLTLVGCGAPASSTSPSSSAGGPPTQPVAASEGPSSPGVTPTASPATPTATPAPPATGTWARLEVGGASPAAREDHTWTVDGEGRVAWLFGGRDGKTDFDDLWAFDLQTRAWRAVEVIGEAPAARFGHEAAWVPGRGLVIFGGQAGPAFFDDLWLFEPNPDGVSGSWRLLPPGGGAPVARYGSCSGMGPDGRFWISHGFTEDGIRFADTQAYDFASEAWSEQAPATERPIQRCLHVCWWTAGGQLALYGGQTTGVPALGDLWLLSVGGGGAPTNAWAEAPDQAPSARNLPAIARWGDATILFGGRGTDRKALGQTWLAIDGSPGFERFPTPVGEPSARSGAAMIPDPVGHGLLLFGGLGGDALGDLWALSFP